MLRCGGHRRRDLVGFVYYYRRPTYIIIVIIIYCNIICVCIYLIWSSRVCLHRRLGGRARCLKTERVVGGSPALIIRPYIHIR